MLNPQFSYSAGIFGNARNDHQLFTGKDCADIFFEISKDTFSCPASIRNILNK